MGVKSLWSLLTPVGRPVMLETMEGKVMAIDSSIWIYQFQATMRDKDGRALTNAHVLGFLRRISKLLFYGIKPVFVFDGGAPVLKRSTLNERRKKKSGAAVSHAKLAEKLLAAQLRREAVNQATKGKKKVADPTDLEDPHTVYLEDIDPRAPKTPTRPKPPTPSSSTKKKAKFYDHDPYKLPEVDLDSIVGKRTQPSAPDPRLATEEELRAFIEDMRPEDFDINSPSFRELPTEVKYEIIGDLRIKSRQTSFARLQKMLKNSQTPLDFSKQQIQNLKQRNALTQQLLVTTDNIGSANISIPVRIASERNREYVLIKNNDGSGGWILGVKDTTGRTYEQPIEIDHDEEDDGGDEDSDADMEEVDIAPANEAVDPDLREYQRQNALSALSTRNTDKGLAPISRRPINRRPKETPLFEMNDSDLSEDERIQMAVAEGQAQDEDDEALAFAIQASLDNRHQVQSSGGPIASSSRVTLDSGPHTPERRPSTLRALSPRADSEDDFDDMYATPNRLSTALTFAHSHHDSGKVADGAPSGMFGLNPLLTPSKVKPPSAKGERALGAEADTDMGVLEISVPIQVARGRPEDVNLLGEQGDDIDDRPTEDVGQFTANPQSLSTSATLPVANLFEPTGLLARRQSPPSPPVKDAVSVAEAIEVDVSDDDMEEVPTGTSAILVRRDEGLPAETVVVDVSDSDMEEVQVGSPAGSPHEPVSEPPGPPRPITPPSHTVPISSSEPELAEVPSTPPATTQFQLAPDSTLFLPATGPRSPSPQPPPPAPYAPPSPPHGDDFERDFAGLEQEQEQEQHEEEFDAAAEMDVHAEEGQFAEFLSQVKGRDLHDVRREIDEEITVLNQQKKAALRDAEDVTQQMVNQIMTMLRLFGIPYITAPMEAEAQCAELVTLGLVDGVITDDSDVFLFGAARVFKNMFNQSKTVECFLSTDLERELGLDRDTLIQLAYLLGSDYTDGLQGVGPVVAMELLKEFPGKDGLWKFREWWSKVQSGRDTEKESGSKFRRMFKRKFKSLYLSTDWPNTTVRDAYYHPAVDSSEEPFKWGLPDLDALRHFFGDELHWPHPKTDDLLLPIIQKMNKRTQAGAVNRQGVLSDWMGLSVAGGSGTMAPRQRQAYASKRLQEVVKDFRKRRTGGAVSREGSTGQETEGEEDDVDAPAKKKRKAGAGAKGKAKAKPRARVANTGDGEEGTAKAAKRKAPAKKAGARGKGKGKRKTDDSENESSDNGSAFDEGGDGTVDVEVPLNVELRPRPKPRPKPVRRPAQKGGEGDGDAPVEVPGST